MVDDLNTIGKHYINQLMSNIKLPGSKTFDSQILIYSCTQNNDVSMAKEFQNHLSKDHCKNGVTDQRKCIKISSQRKWTDIEYHFQDDTNVAHN